MRSWFLLFSLLLSLAFTQSACDLREGTIVYDIDVPPDRVGRSSSLVLNEAPTANVMLTIALPDGEISSSPTTFTPSNWNIAQIVTISAVEDGVVDSNQDTSFTVSVRSSSTPRLVATCLLYTSPSPRDRQKTRMPSSA